jgi:DNA-binding PadR family transcriptional regulator
MSTADHREAAAVSNPSLTKFRIRILAILAEEARYGLAIKRALEDYYGTEQNHGRLYSNLDTLVDDGLAEKGQLDRRTNEYSITAAGEQALREEINWLSQRVDAGEEIDETARTLREADS